MQFLFLCLFQTKLAWNGYIMEKRYLHFKICRNSKYPIMCEAGQGKERLQWQDGVGNIQVRIFLGGKYLEVWNIQGCKFCTAKYWSVRIFKGGKHQWTDNVHLKFNNICWKNIKTKKTFMNYEYSGVGNI